MEALHNLRFATGQVMADLQKRAATQPPPGKIRHSRTLPKSRQQADRADSTHGSGASNSPEAQKFPEQPPIKSEDWRKPPELR